MFAKLKLWLTVLYIINTRSIIPPIFKRSHICTPLRRYIILDNNMYVRLRIPILFIYFPIISLSTIYIYRGKNIYWCQHIVYNISAYRHMCCNCINIYICVLFPRFGRRYDLRLLISGERCVCLLGFVCHKPIPFDSEPVNFRIRCQYKGITSTPIFSFLK